MAKENNPETTVSDPAVDGVDANRVYIFDTTLRDGEQSPGASLTSAEKLEIARQLSRLGVDIMEAGFPAASPDDLLGVQRIAQEIGTPDGPVITGLARATKGDIDKAWEAVQYAAKPRIHTFLATSDIHMEHKLRMTREEVVARTREMVAYAKSYCDDIEFSPEGTLLAVQASESTHVAVWDVATWTKKYDLREHEGNVTDLDFSAGGQWLVTAGEDGTARVWDVATGD